MCRSAVVLSLVAAIAAREAARAATSVFEDAVVRVAHSGMVVRATVVDVPLATVPDPADSSLLLRYQRVRIEECYFDAAGDCASRRGGEIRIPVPAGVRRITGGRSVEARIFTGSTAVDVATLEPDAEYLLFLVPAGDGDVWRVVPTRQGRRPILRGGTGLPRVELAFRDAAALADPAASDLVGNAVPLDRLPALIDQVLAQPPRQPRRGPTEAERRQD